MEKEIKIKVNEDIIKGLNNAIVVYGDIIGSIMFKCNVPNKFEKLKTLSEDELTKRFQSIKELYLYIEEQYRR